MRPPRRSQDQECEGEGHGKCQRQLYGEDHLFCGGLGIDKEAPLSDAQIAGGKEDQAASRQTPAKQFTRDERRLSETRHHRYDDWAFPHYGNCAGHKQVAPFR